MDPSTGFQEFKQYNFIGQQERAMYKKYKHTYCNYIPLLIMENDIDGNKLQSSYKIVCQTYRESGHVTTFVLGLPIREFYYPGTTTKVVKSKPYSKMYTLGA